MRLEHLLSGALLDGACTPNGVHVKAYETKGQEKALVVQPIFKVFGRIAKGLNAQNGQRPLPYAVRKDGGYGQEGLVAQVVRALH